jgi:hypothetical protein
MICIVLIGCAMGPQPFLDAASYQRMVEAWFAQCLEGRGWQWQNPVTSR